MEASADEHEDRGSIPQVIEVIKSLLKETQPGVLSANQKVELWRYNANLVFKPGEVVVSAALSRVSLASACLITSAWAGHGPLGGEQVAHIHRQAASPAGQRLRVERVERAVCVAV